MKNRGTEQNLDKEGDLNKGVNIERKKERERVSDRLKEKILTS